MFLLEMLLLSNGKHTLFRSALFRLFGAAGDEIKGSNVSREEEVSIAKRVREPIVTKFCDGIRWVPEKKKSAATNLSLQHVVQHESTILDIGPR
jgi:hypothetical protein